MREGLKDAGWIAVVALLGVCLLPGCTILREYPRRSELTLKAVAHNAPDKPERTIDTTVILHGSNRDVLQSYEHALQFTLERLGLEK